MEWIEITKENYKDIPFEPKEGSIVLFSTSKVKAFAGSFGFNNKKYFIHYSADEDIATYYWNGEEYKRQDHRNNETIKAYCVVEPYYFATILNTPYPSSFEGMPRLK